MIVCGIIQSPERNSDRLIVHQIAGEPQDSNSIINAQIDLAAAGKCISNSGIKGWRRRKTGEWYLETMTRSSDSSGRPIVLGIYLKKEGKESPVISRDTIVDLLNKFSLEMDDVSISNVESFIATYLTGTVLSKILPAILSVVLLLIVIFFVVFLRLQNGR